MQLVSESDKQPMLLLGNRKLIINNTLRTFLDNYFVPPTKSVGFNYTNMSDGDTLDGLIWNTHYFGDYSEFSNRSTGMNLYPIYGYNEISFSGSSDYSNSTNINNNCFTFDTHDIDIKSILLEVKIQKLNNGNNSGFHQFFQFFYPRTVDVNSTLFIAQQSLRLFLEKDSNNNFNLKYYITGLLSNEQLAVGTIDITHLTISEPFWILVDCNNVNNNNQFPIISIYSDLFGLTQIDVVNDATMYSTMDENIPEPVYVANRVTQFAFNMLSDTLPFRIWFRALEIHQHKNTLPDLLTKSFPISPRTYRFIGLYAPVANKFPILTEWEIEYDGGSIKHGNRSDFDNDFSNFVSLKQHHPGNSYDDSHDEYRDLVDGDIEWNNGFSTPISGSINNNSLAFKKDQGSGVYFYLKLNKFIPVPTVANIWYWLDTHSFTGAQLVGKNYTANSQNDWTTLLNFNETYVQINN